MSPRSIYRLIVAILAAFTLAGCSNVESMKFGPKTVFEDVKEKLEAPGKPFTPRFSIGQGSRRVQAWDNVDDAREVFARPKRAFEFSDRPATLGSAFKTEGWESASDGYGIISYEDRVVAAVREQYKVAPEAVRNMFMAFIDAYQPMEPTRILGQTCEYAFWTLGDEVLMISSVKVADGQFNLTIAVGDKLVMSALRMDPALAIADKNRADAFVADQQAKAAGSDSQ